MTRRRLLLAALFALVLAETVHYVLVERPADQRYERWNAAHCTPAVLDRHGNAVTPAGDRWPCSEDLPLP